MAYVISPKPEGRPAILIYYELDLSSTNIEFGMS